MGNFKPIDPLFEAFKELKGKTPLLWGIYGGYTLFALSSLAFLLWSYIRSKRTLAALGILLFGLFHMGAGLCFKTVYSPGYLLILRTISLIITYVMTSVYALREHPKEFFKSARRKAYFISHNSRIRLFIFLALMINFVMQVFYAVELWYEKGQFTLVPDTFFLITPVLLAVPISGILYSLIKVVAIQLQREEELNDQLLLAVDKESKANKIKSLFMSNMSHELRTPLNGMSGMARMMAHEDSGEKRVLLLSQYQRCCATLETIIDDLLDFSQIESAITELTLEDTRLGKLVEPVLNMHKQRALDKGLEVEININLPLGLPVRTDPKRLQQIFNNILSNAIKFTPKGKISVQIEGIRQHDKEWIRTKISDTGIGIPKAKIKNLFKMFEQLDNGLSKKYEGVGLGLSIAQRLIKALNGSIEVKSEEGKGTSIYLLLPNNPSDADDTINLPEQPPLQMKDLTVLVAEDNPINMMIINKTLQNIGVHPICVSDGAKALEECINRQIDLVFMDIQMPVMDGIQATEEIMRLNKPKPCIVAVTADTNPEDRLKCEKAGMKDYIIKPFSEERIHKVATGVLQRKCQSRFPETQK